MILMVILIINNINIMENKVEIRDGVEWNVTAANIQTVYSKRNVFHHLS